MAQNSRDGTAAFQRLFHFSQSPLRAGIVLEPRGRFNVDRRVEDILEAVRPAEDLPRRQSVYLMGTARDVSLFGLCPRGFLYEVWPIGQVARRDAAIIGLLQRVRANEDLTFRAILPIGWQGKEACQALAALYWRGNENPYSDKPPVWEYVVPGARILRIKALIGGVGPGELSDEGHELGS
jgi:hypothetical protein